MSLNKQWDNQDFRKVFQFANDEKKHKKMLIESLNHHEQNELILERIKASLNDDYPTFLDMMSRVYKELDEDVKRPLFEWVIEHSDFENEAALLQELQYYHFFIETIQNQKEYLHIITLQQVIENLSQANLQDLETITHYLLARYYFEKKANKNDYLERSHEKGEVLYQIIDAYFQHNKDYLIVVAQAFFKEEQLLQQDLINKKIEKIMHKATKKLDDIYYCQLPQETKITQLEELKVKVLHKLPIESNEFEQYPLIHRFLQTLQQYLEYLTQQQPIEYNEIIDSLPTQPMPDEQQLQLIEAFYHQHHLYYKKSQIIEELLENPFVIQFYQFYNQIDELTDCEEMIKKLEELILDIRESGLKNKEILRRLLSVAQKEVQDFIQSEEKEEIVEEPLPIPIQNTNEVMKIGKFYVLKESVEDNPVNIQKIVQLLAKEDQKEIAWLKSLVYQIGYDKVHAYLLKSPAMSIVNLQTIIQLDRSLRFEYQRILEDIEMYFRSSFTYFLSNKYDQKYLMASTYQPFYKRGYLMGNLFEDKQEHYDQVKLLRNRIDDEIKNNNLQIVEEYRRYKYALPFSTAAGIMTFGWMINVFENLNYYDKAEYLRCYFERLTPQTFWHWMMSLNNLRNHCAHYQSLYRLSSLKELRPIMTKDVDSNGYDDDFKHSSLFYYTLIMIRLSPNVFNAEDFIDSVGILLRKAGRESGLVDLLKDYSFPKNWRYVLENEKSSKIHLVD